MNLKLKGLITLVVVVFTLFFSVIPAVVASQKEVILATTTSTQDSGLLDVLIPVFEKKTGYFVKTIAVGSGQAMAMGQKGEADVLLVHSTEAEVKFVAEGFGLNRRLIMHNDFILVGPPEDPAKVMGKRSAAEAFENISSAKALLLSRGDNSGTHAKEKQIWKISGIHPEEERWYQQTGLGMGQTLNIASEKKAYTLSDRGTYLALKKNLRLNILVEGDPLIRNLYHIIEINPAKWPKVNAAGAKAFSEFLISGETQEIIKTFGVEKFGSPLFFPDAASKAKDIKE